MKFGPVPVSDAEGAILAHTHRLPERRILKKGRVLDGADVAHLRAAGLATVVAARLETGDLGEDDAAAAVAAAVVGPAVRVAGASTGRANVFAERDGVLVVRADAVDRLNLVDEAVTLGTLAPFATVVAGEMVATVKIIPFAVPEATIDRVCRTATDGGGAIVQVAPFRPRRAGLVLTRLPGMSEGLLDRAERSQRTRLARLGGSLASVVRCAHRREDVAEAVVSVLAAGAELVLLMGASAIVDRADVIPSAVVAAGGSIAHLGMPVDPGNLLLLARLGPDGAVPAVGVPGCARSLKESGFDWVLARLCAGLSVDGAAIMRMGAGGLLKEIAARPQPREAPQRTPEVVDGEPRSRRLGAVVLAAGQSRRMGDRNKLLEPVAGKPLVAHVVDAFLSTASRPVVVVVGHEADRVRAALAMRDVRFVENPAFADGMSTSLRVGIRAVSEAGVDGAYVALGDMPWVRRHHLEALAASFDPSADQGICVPVHDRKRGNPVLWAASYFPEMQRITGDVGARALLRTHADQLTLVPVDDPAVHVDVDTPEALAGLAGKGRSPGGSAPG